ncbi:hypothetical protein [Dyadobacter sandarakinus]|uniref:Stress-induced acidophilic repeat motif-containing protein n=1 Tax=Dyadobacter sandarakinus TaxID=2747268 RepID=A0ABX7I452_9BACT|nr:hypothetical protein [Dyadobacter sandarakinus]QRR00638.1 hypothetical protein HWI92_06805 [Dyadobacter sandarakinus]
MEPNEENSKTDEVKDPAVREALARGRNANDNFQDGSTDDYGIDKSSPEAQDELEEREQVKGGRGQHGTGRNRNDDFN